MDEHGSKSRYAVVLAGGRGTRLWPLSTAKRPKQFLPLNDPKASMLEVTLRRAERLVPAENVLIVGDVQHRAELERLAGSARLLLEPVGRNTAAAIAFATAAVSRAHPHASIVVLSADHVILNESHWQSVMEAALRHAESTGDLVTVGVPADAPETRYGYMRGDRIVGEIDGFTIRHVVRFLEKPDTASLLELMEAGDCLRNMGMFVWTAEGFLAELERAMPALAAQVGRWSATGCALEEGAIPAAIYATLPSVSIDHGVLQVSERLAVIASAIRRVDVGDFSAFAEIWPRDPEGNAVQGRFVGVDASDNVVFSGDRMVAAVGLSGYVVVVTDDTVLVCPKQRTQDIRELVSRFGEREDRTPPKQGSAS